MNEKQEIILLDEIVEAFEISMKLNILGKNAMFSYYPGIGFSVKLMDDEERNITETIDGYLGDHWKGERKTVEDGLAKLYKKVMQIREEK